MSRLHLDARLAAIAELLGQCDTYADIGCDHGRLGAWLLQNDRVRHAVLTDISAPSLEKARALIDLLGYRDRVTFAVGDGADALPCPVDAAVIAGMGGDTVVQIIQNGQTKLGKAKLVLQANVDAPAVRKALSECGYRISAERIVRDEKRLYVILSAERGHAAYTDTELEVGPCLMRERPETLKPYAEFRIRVAQKALNGAIKGGDEQQAALLNRQLTLWKEVASWLQP